MIHGEISKFFFAILLGAGLTILFLVTYSLESRGERSEENHVEYTLMRAHFFSKMWLAYTVIQAIYFLIFWR